MSDEDMEDYGFTYSDDGSDAAESEGVDIENAYYNGKTLAEDSPEEAMASFNSVVAMEQEVKGEWGFKALKQLVKLKYAKNDVSGMMASYKEMLTYTHDAVTRNQAEKKINSLLDFVSKSTNLDLLQEFYETTLQALQESNNERLAFKTNLKLCNLYYERGEYLKLTKILKTLKQECQTADGEDDPRKGTALLEVYALEIQMFTAQKNNKKLKQLYQKALTVKSAIPHPKIMGVIRECGGKMHMHDGVWTEAATDFFEAFKSYDEAGLQRRVQCLKYLVLAYMLMESEVDPFESQEARPYKSDKQVVAMTTLVEAYQQNDIRRFEHTLRTEKATIMDDPFIRIHIEDLLAKIRTQVVVRLIQPYTSVRMPFISSKLNIPESEVEQLLVGLILDGRIRGRIDQVQQLLVLKSATSNEHKYSAIDKWTTQLEKLNSSICGRASG